MGLPTSPKPAARRRWLYRGLLALVLGILLVSGAFVYFFWNASWELDETLAEIDWLDPGWRLTDIEAQRKVVADADNAALLIIAVRKMIGSPVYTPSQSKLVSALPAHVALGNKDAAELQKRWEACRLAVLEARKLKDLPEGRWPFNYGADAGVAASSLLDARNVCDLLELDAMCRLHVRDASGALEACLAMLHAAQSTDNDPSLFALLVRHGCTAMAVRALERTLAHGPISLTSAATLERVQAALAREPREHLLQAMRGERAFAHHFFLALGEGKSIGPATTDVTLYQHFPGFRIASTRVPCACAPPSWTR